MFATNNKNSDINIKVVFGFWLYIMSDCIVFASLFAMYMVLSGNCLYENLGKNVFELTFVFIETCILLLSSLTCGKSMIYVKFMNVKEVQKWMIITLLLGLCFISMEIYEFYHFIQSGYDLCCNAFFSSFFVLVGTHGMHVFLGLIWIIIMLIHVKLYGLTYNNKTRLTCLSLFWHFLDIVWICVFTEVYLIGVL